VPRDDGIVLRTSPCSTTSASRPGRANLVHEPFKGGREPESIY